MHTLPEAPPSPPDPARLVWVFGYGSLMWNPGFAPERFEPARLDGWHRRLCILSQRYRGTPERPGLVLGLAQGGACVGRAIGVSPAREAEVLAQLDERELITHVYERRRVPLRLLACGSVVEAWAYVARPEHPQFRDLDEAQTLALVRQGVGRAGACRDYVLNTLDHLVEMGIDEPMLRRLGVALRSEISTVDGGLGI